MSDMSKWGTIQFNHHDLAFRGFRYTVAVQVPSSEVLREMVTQMVNGTTPNSLNVSIGYTIVHPKDNYDKRIGRELSTSRMEPKEFTLGTLRFIKAGKVEITLISKDNVCIQLNVLTNKQSVPRLLDVWGLKGDME